MAIKTSTGLRNKMLDTGSLRTVMNLGFVKIYSGVVPATADDAVTGTLLVTISNASGGTGLTHEAVAVLGAISKTTAEVWSGVNVTGGVATHYRHVAVGDDGTLSTSQARVQGLIANVGSDMNLTNTTLTGGATQTIDYYQLYLPTL